MAFYRIKSWRDYQHYTDRSPPWIKLHRNTLSSRVWVRASDSDRVLAIACMLVAADTDNQIPADPEYLMRVAYLKELPNFAKLVELQFLELVGDVDETLAVASTTLADASKCSSEERRGEKRRGREDTSVGRQNDQPAWVAELRQVYPKRGGANPWPAAVKAGNARIREGHLPAEFIDGARRYAAFIKATEKLGTQYVMQAATFLGPNKSFLESWDLPATKADARYQANIDTAQQWASQGES